MYLLCIMYICAWYFKSLISLYGDLSHTSQRALSYSCRDLGHIEAPVYSVKAHGQIVNCLDAVGGLGIGGGAPEIVTGSRDGECIFSTWYLELSPALLSAYCRDSNTSTHNYSKISKQRTG